MPDKSRTQDMRLSFSNAPRFDQSPQLVPVMDSNNVVLSPDGSEARNRPGSEIRNVYRCVTNPVGRKAIIIESNPPDVDLGKMFMVVNTANNQNVIEQIEFVNNRADSGFEPITNYAFFAEYEVTSIGFGTISNALYRTGDLSVAATVRWTVTADSAEPPTPGVLGATGTVTFAAGANTAAIVTGISYTPTFGAILTAIFTLSPVSQNVRILNETPTPPSTPHLASVPVVYDGV